MASAKFPQALLGLGLIFLNKVSSRKECLYSNFRLNLGIHSDTNLSGRMASISFVCNYRWRPSKMNTLFFSAFTLVLKKDPDQVYLKKCVCESTKSYVELD